MLSSRANQSKLAAPALPVQVHRRSLVALLCLLLLGLEQFRKGIMPSRGGLSASWKEAKLETGLSIMVPLFIANGEIIRVDTAEKKYVGRAGGDQ